jgi:hypothetical protein
MSIEVRGLKEALRDLQKLEPELRKEINKDIRKTVRPLVDNINGRIPGAPPLSGMAHNGRTGWTRKKPVAIKIDARAPRNRPNRPFQSRRAPQYRRPNFARALSSRLGQPSRFMWRDIDNDLELIQREFEPIVDRVERALDRDLKTSF